MGLLTGIVIIVSLIIGFVTKIYLGETRGEQAQDMIENIIQVQAGVDLEPIFDLDNELKK